MSDDTSHTSGTLMDELPDVTHMPKRDRDRLIWQWHTSGVPIEVIAQHCSLSDGRIREILAKMRGYVRPPDREEMRRQAYGVMSQIQQRMIPILQSPGAPMVKVVGRGENMGGKIVAVKDPDSGEYVREQGAPMAAARELVRASNLIADMFGLKEATRIETSGTVKYEIVSIDTDAMK